MSGTSRQYLITCIVGLSIIAVGAAIGISAEYMLYELSVDRFACDSRCPHSIPASVGPQVDQMIAKYHLVAIVGFSIIAVGVVLVLASFFLTRRRSHRNR